MINSNDLPIIHITKSGQAVDTPDKKCVLTNKQRRL